MAKCSSCAAVFGFADKVAGAALHAKREVQMPRGYSLGTDGADLVITRRWFSAKYIFLLFFCIFWDGFLFFWYSTAVSGGAPLVAILFPLLHVGVGVFLTYTTIAGFLNRTRVSVNPAELRIKHYPLPWPGNRTVPRQELEQLFCSEKLSNSKNGVHYTYGLYAVLAGGRREKLVTGLDSPEDALFLEQKIEGYLGITDRPVVGEMRPA